MIPPWRKGVLPSTQTRDEGTDGDSGGVGAGGGGGVGVGRQGQQGCREGEHGCEGDCDLAFHGMLHFEQKLEI